MDSSIAEMTCVLKVKLKCEACRTKIYKVLQNIHGVYKINLDAEQGTVKVSGKVNPSTLLTVLEGSGKHAEIKSVTFDGEVRDNSGYDNYFGEAGYGHDPYGYRYGYNPYGYPPYGGFGYQYWDDPSRLIMMPLVAPPPPPPPLALPSSTAPQSQFPAPQQQSKALPSQTPTLPAPPPEGNVANGAVKPAGSGKKSKCCIM